MLEVRCFGGVEVVGPDGAPRSLRSRKHRALLLYLAAHQRTTHAREDLADLLWDGTGKRERHSLSQALYDIRSKCGEIVEMTSTSVRVVPDQISYEADGFEVAVESGDHETALDLYRGEFAPELVSVGAEMFDRWTDSEREHCRVLASMALRNAQRVAEDRGDWDRMCLAALRLTRLNEFDEEAHCALMRGLWMKGDPASALRHFRALPDELTLHWRAAHDLANRIDASDAVREVLTVPRPPVPLIGREEEFEELNRLVQALTPSGGVVALLGEPGVGKTALALEYQRLAAARRQDGSHERPEALIVIDDPGNLEDAGRPGPGRVCLVETCDPTTLGFEDGLVRLHRLSQADLERVLRQVDGAGKMTTHRTAWELSAGNPTIAKDVAKCLAISGSEQGAVACGDEMGLRALAHSPRLQKVVSRMQETLGPEGRYVANRLACLRRATRVALDRQRPSEAWSLGLTRLEELGALRREDGDTRLAVELLSVAIRTGLGPRRADFVSEAVERLRTGDALEAYAASNELLHSGRHPEALACAMRSVSLARSRGDLAIASRAAQVASAAVPHAEDRHQLSVLRAEVELDRGRVSEAERVARESAALARSDHEVLAAQEILCRTLIAQREWNASKECLSRIHALTADFSDTEHQPLAALLRAKTRLLVARSRQLDSGGSDLVASLETWLDKTKGTAKKAPGTWLAGFRALYMYRVATSLEEAQGVVDLFATTLLDLGVDEGRTVYENARATLDIRSGRLRVARAAVEGVIERRPITTDRMSTVALNNLAIVLSELGSFASAARVIDDLESLDESLGAVNEDRAFSALNRAQAAWGAGRPEMAAKIALNAVRNWAPIPGASGRIEGLAIAGLSAYELGDMDTALNMAAKIDESAVMPGEIADGFFVHWLLAMAQPQSLSRKVVALDERAEAMEFVDRVAAAKLRCVSATMRGSGENRENDAGALRRMGAGWFPRRANRFVAAVDH